MFVTRQRLEPPPTLLHCLSSKGRVDAGFRLPPLKLMHNCNNDNQPTKVYVTSHLSIRRRCARWSVLEASRLENLHINTDLKIFIRIKNITFSHKKVVSRKQNFRKFRVNYMYSMRISNSNSTHSCSECFGWTMEESGPLRRYWFSTG